MESGAGKRERASKVQFQDSPWGQPQPDPTGCSREEVPLRGHPPFPSWALQSRPGIQGCSEHKTGGERRYGPPVFSSILRKERNPNTRMILLR